MSVGLFAYGSLVAAKSASETLGRQVEPRPASLRGWRRSWTLARDNRACEKTFSRPDGSIPDVVLALNLQPDTGSEVHGALLDVDEAELARLDVREVRYERVDISDDLETEGGESPDATVTYVARPENVAASPPVGAVILATYERAVEAAFAGLGGVERFRSTTLACAAERIEPVLVSDSIPPGNPRDW